MWKNKLRGRHMRRNWLEIAAIAYIYWLVMKVKIFIY